MDQEYSTILQYKYLYDWEKIVEDLEEKVKKLGKEVPERPEALSIKQHLKNFHYEKAEELLRSLPEASDAEPISAQGPIFFEALREIIDALILKQEMILVEKNVKILSRYSYELQKIIDKEKTSKWSLHAQSPANQFPRNGTEPSSSEAEPEHTIHKQSLRKS